MKRVLFNVGKNLCDECSLALMRFIGHLDGVESIVVEGGKIAVRFNDSMISEEDLLKITRDSIEKLGYSVIE